MSLQLNIIFLQTLIKHEIIKIRILLHPFKKIYKNLVTKCNILLHIIKESQQYYATSFHIYAIQNEDNSAFRKHNYVLD